MARRTRSKTPAPTPPLILDSGAVIALSRNDARVRMFLERALQVGSQVLVPVAVVAETTRGSGPRDAPVNRVLRAVGIPPSTQTTGRIAGTLLGRAGSTDTIDALVVAEAVAAGGGRVLTGDPDDLMRLAPAGVRVHAVGRDETH